MSREEDSYRVDVSDEDLHEDFSKEDDYGGYLGLSGLLSLQNTITQEHDEMMFVLVHQISELWIKLALHELQAAVRLVQDDHLDPSFKMLSRVARIQSQLEQVWGVVATMTPADYVAFRDSLGHASGFQSYQYRKLEFTLGNKNPAMIRVFKDHPAIHEDVKATLHAPSLYDEALALLSRRGLPVPEHKLKRDWSEPYVPDEGVEQVWLQVYRDPKKYWDLYELAEKLVDVEDNFHRWRFRHMKTVERIIGFKRGTGGSAGVGYLKKALDLKFYPELWTVRTAI